MSDRFEEALEMYKTVISRCKAAGMSRANSKITAKSEVFEMYPDLLNHELPTGAAARFWSKTSNIVNNAFGNGKQKPLPYPIENTRPAHTVITVPVPAGHNRPFTQVVRELAETGFIPYGVHLKPLINGKHDQIHAYVSKIKAEGFYRVEKTRYGWVCEPIETPEVRKAREDAAAAEAEATREAARLAEIENEKTKAKERLAAMEASLWAQLTEIEALRAKL